jgi:hypothetical protein
MSDTSGSNIFIPTTVHRRWNDTKRPLGVTSARFAEVLLNRWHESTPDEQGRALATPTRQPVRRQRRQQPEPANA